MPQSCFRRASGCTDSRFADRPHRSRLVAPEKNRFKYKLQATIATGRSVGNRRQAFYDKPPPRSYHFRVIAANNNGVRNETGGCVEFSIASVQGLIVLLQTARNLLPARPTEAGK